MAMYTLGNVYASEKYGMQDLDEAVKWYRWQKTMVTNLLSTG